MTGILRTTTENGDPSYTTTGDAVLDFFYKVNRNSSKESVQAMIKEAYVQEPDLALKALFHLRDCRGGKGERRCWGYALEWMADNTLVMGRLIQYIPEYGCWKDMFMLMEGLGTLSGDAINIYADQLLLDLYKINGLYLGLSLAAKWIPRERGKLNRKYNIIPRLISAMNTRTRTHPITPPPSAHMLDSVYRYITSYFRPSSQLVLNNTRDFRKNVVAPLRKYLNIVEQKMCAGAWDSIDYSTVGSLAMNKYKGAFGKHSPRFAEYLEDVSAGVDRCACDSCFLIILCPKSLRTTARR